MESGAERAWRGICPDERAFQAETKAPPAFRRDRSAPMKGQMEAASGLIRGAVLESARRGALKNQSPPIRLQRVERNERDGSPFVE